jgi:hypothetical protein
MEKYAFIASPQFRYNIPYILWLWLFSYQKWPTFLRPLNHPQKMTNGFHKLHTAKKSKTRFHNETVYGPRLKHHIQKTRAQVPLTKQILHLYPDCGFVSLGRFQDTTSFNDKCFLPNPFQCTIHQLSCHSVFYNLDTDSTKTTHK